MSKYSPSGYGDIAAIKNDGTPVAVVEAVGCTLQPNSTYFFPFGGPDAPLPGETSLVSAHCMWSDAMDVVLSIETTNFPKYKGDVRTDPEIDTADTDTTPGKWIHQDPPGQYVPGSGFTLQNLTATVTEAGGCEFDISQFASRRGHIKATTGARGGDLRVNLNGKVGA